MTILASYIYYYVIYGNNFYYSYFIVSRIKAYSFCSYSYSSYYLLLKGSGLSIKISDCYYSLEVEDEH